MPVKRIDCEDGLGVIRDDDLENPAKEIPRGLARFDRPRGRLLEGRIDEAVPRAHRGKDPRAKPSFLPCGSVSQPTQPVSSCTSCPGSPSSTGIVVAVFPNWSSRTANRCNVGYAI